MHNVQQSSPSKRRTHSRDVFQTPPLIEWRGFLFLLQLLLELLDLGADDGAAVTLFGILAVVILVITLGLVEFLQRHDLSDDLSGEVFLRRSFRFLCYFLLRG